MQLWNFPELCKSFTSGSAEVTSWKSWTCVPKLVCNFIAIFHMPNYLGSEGRSWLILQLKSLLWSDRPHRWVGSNTGQAKIIILSSSSILWNKFKKSKWSRYVSQTNLALTWSKSWIKPKTYRLCVPNLVPRKATLGHSWASRILNFVLRLSNSVMSKVVGCQWKLPPTWLVSAGSLLGISLWMAFFK